MYEFQFKNLELLQRIIIRCIFQYFNNSIKNINRNSLSKENDGLQHYYYCCLNTIKYNIFKLIFQIMYYKKRYILNI